MNQIETIERIPLLPMASAQVNIIYKSSPSSSLYYKICKQIAERIRESSMGKIMVTVEESQSFINNINEVIHRRLNYIFISTPNLVKFAVNGQSMFKNNENKRFEDIRALFPIPSLTMHFVMLKDSGVKKISDMKGKTIFLGEGFSKREGKKYLTKFNIINDIKLAEIDKSNVIVEFKNKQIDGFVIAGPYPISIVNEALKSIKAAVISMSHDQIKTIQRTPIKIPAGTYYSQLSPIITSS